MNAVAILLHTRCIAAKSMSGRPVGDLAWHWHHLKREFNRGPYSGAMALAAGPRLPTWLVVAALVAAAVLLGMLMR